MDIKKLLSGIAIIIDDKINDNESGDKILQIREKLRSEQIPFIEYEDIPGNEIISNFNNVSFVLLDWELFDRPEPGMKIDEEIFIKNNIDFIRKIKETTFVPKAFSLQKILTIKRMCKNNFTPQLRGKAKEKEAKT